MEGIVSGHQWLYYGEDLRQRLGEAAFNQIEDRNWGVGDWHERGSFGNGRESGLVCEARL